ncbi:hypothetical protein CEQ90_07955 [Lewinellaceae bacterium SD302]|nr:hypothetical protein CEQ90_07955 [Lewinellaceae bacterium SD302]
MISCTIRCLLLPLLLVLPGLALSLSPLPRDTAYDASFDLDEGYRHLNEGDYRTAQMYFFRALDTVRFYGPPTETYRAYRYLNDLYQNLQDNRQMLRFAELAHELSKDLSLPHQTDSFERLYMGYGVNERYAEAEQLAREWKTFLYDHPDEVRDIDFVHYYEQHGYYHNNSGRHQDAIDAYKQALSYNQDGSVPEYERRELMVNIGWELNYLGRYAEAIPYFEAFVFHPENLNDSTTLYDDIIQLALAYEKTGNYEAGITQLRRGYEMRIKNVLNEAATTMDGLAMRDELHDQDDLIQAQLARISTQERNQQLILGIAVLFLLGAVGLFLGLRINRRKNAQLAAKNQENETLLKEIHHRVKNNLEIVSSLLELQSATLAEGDARDAMLAGQSRVASMGLLHQKLYQGHDLATVNMYGYLEDLTDAIAETYEVEKEVNFSIEVPTVLELDVDRAVPVGLIVNELVTNSLKYAFAPGAAIHPQITVALTPENGKLRLLVSDNGVGKAAVGHQGTGFGTRLVRLLTTQLNGTLREEDNGGLRTEIDF